MRDAWYLGLWYIIINGRWTANVDSCSRLSVRVYVLEHEVVKNAQLALALCGCRCAVARLLKHVYDIENVSQLVSVETIWVAVTLDVVR